MIKLNGKEIEFRENITVLDIVHKYDFDIKRIAVEINENIISKKDYDKTIINDQDTIEVVSFVGGG